MIDRVRLAGLLARERDQLRRAQPAVAGGLRRRHPPVRPGADDVDEQAGRRLPALPRRRAGRRVTDLDGHTYVDLCLGDTGAMAGHSPQPVIAAVQARLAEGGLTAMMPTEDAAWVGAELARRFGLPYWSFTLTATDANRWAIRLARALTGRGRDPVQQLLLPRQRRRVAHRARRRAAGVAPGQRRRALRRAVDQPGRRVQRR